MATRLSVNEAKTRLSEYLNRVTYRGERFVVERHGKPVGALVSLDDLAKLESPAPVEQDDMAAREEAFHQKMWEDGLLAHPPRKGPRRPAPLPPLLKLPPGVMPLSEQIIADKEYRDRQLLGEQRARQVVPRGEGLGMGEDAAGHESG